MNVSRSDAVSPRLLVAIAIALVTLVAYAQPTAPDSIYVNGTVLTMDGSARTVEAVSVKGDRIADVGANADIRRSAGSSTRLVDLNGKVLLPGLIDAHSHFPGNGTNALYVVNVQSPPLGRVNSIDDLIAALKQKARQTPKGEWIRGAGYDQTLLKEGRHPTRYDLDRASTDHPIYISHASGHLGVANSLALRISEVTKDTPQPPGGVIQKDPQTGDPNGVFEESGQLVARHMPRYSVEQEQAAIKWAVNDYVSHGVTSATLAGGGLSESLKAASREGRLTLRIVAMLGGWDPNRPKAGLIGDEMLKTGLTIGENVHDGSIQGYTGYLVKPYYIPYHGDKTYRGYPRESRETLIGYVKTANRLGYQIAVHANGDQAIDDVIAAYREAFKDAPRADARFRIEHAQMTREDQLDAMKELGISPSFFVSHTYYWGDQHSEIFMGPERAAHMSPLKSALQRGIRFSIHLDTPVTPMSPLQAVWSAVNRVSRTGKVIGPEQRIRPLEALRAVTIDAAWQEHDDKIKGSIEPGKFADFVVLAENPLTVDPMHIKDIRVLQTVVGGRVVYESPAAAARLQ
jgi:predicted amidohydrolase YtcJ